MLLSVTQLIPAFLAGFQTHDRLLHSGPFSILRSWDWGRDFLFPRDRHLTMLFGEFYPIRLKLWDI